MPPTFQGAVLLSEDFSTDPAIRGWVTTAPTNVRWDAAGFYRARVNDIDNLSQYVFSPVFSPVHGTPFVFQFDVNPVQTDWGTYPQIDLIQHGVANPYLENSFKMAVPWNDWRYNQFELGQGAPGEIGLTQQFTLGTWYRHTFSYDPASGQLSWDIVVRDTGSPFFSGTYNVGLLPAFDQISVGYQGVYPQYGRGWAEIWVDNMQLTGGSGTGVKVTPPVIDENGSVRLDGAFVDPGVLDWHTVVVDWSDANAAPVSTFALPKTTELRVGDTFQSSTDTALLTVTAVDTTRGLVGFSVDQHQYLDNLPGDEPYTINVTVTDKDRDAGSSSTEAVVKNVAPHFEGLQVTPTVDEGEEAVLTGTIVDPGTLDTFVVEVNWGDPLCPGTEPYTFGPSATGRQDFRLTHRFVDDYPSHTSSDTYTITVVVRDDDGGVGGAPTWGPNEHLLPQAADGTSLGQVASRGVQALYDGAIPSWRPSPGAVFWESIGTNGQENHVWMEYRWDQPVRLSTSTFYATGEDPVFEYKIKYWEGNAWNELAHVLNARSVESNWVKWQHTDALDGVTTERLRIDFLDVGEYYSNHSQLIYDVALIGEWQVFGQRSTGIGPAALTVTVDNVAPGLAEVVLAPDEIDAGGTVTASGQMTDVGILDTHTVTIVWGDGGESRDVPVDPTTRRFTADHVYQDMPVDAAFVDYEVIVTATDDDDDPSQPVAVPVRVNYSIQLDLSGRVFDDKDNDSRFEPADGDVGVPAVNVQLVNQQTGAVAGTVTTGADGLYEFDMRVKRGTYKLVESQPEGFFDGKEAVGTLGGRVENSTDSNEIWDIPVPPATISAPLGYLPGEGYDFGELRPSRLAGLVWEDLNDDGRMDFGEQGIADVEVRLTGTDDRGAVVDRVMETNSHGIFGFDGLRPSGSAGYALYETQPAGYVDGKETLGTVNGATTGTAVDNAFLGIAMTRSGSVGAGYNFGERPMPGGGVTRGQTATIGFWQNKNGQALIRAFDGGNSTRLGDWLAATLPHIFGDYAGGNSLAGKTNDAVAAAYRDRFALKGVKLDAQLMATALAVYATSSSLGGPWAAAYGFKVTQYGLGYSTYNVGANAAAFGVANNSSVTVMDLLVAADARSAGGVLFGGNATQRKMANSVFDGINTSGDIA